MSTRKMRSPAHLHKLADMISIDQLTKVYGEGENATVVLDRLDFTVKTGEIFAVVGASGAGKSTLAQCVNLLVRPTSGSVRVNGEDLSSLTEQQLRIARLVISASVAEELTRVFHLVTGRNNVS